MSDVLTSEQRHKCMSRIRGRDTKPELIIRSWLHRHGYRFRIQCGHLPGKPDIALKKYKLIIFVNGCYWHRHPGCKYTTTPATNAAFWEEKFTQNVERDKRNIEKLECSGWNILVIWECQVKDGSFEEILENYFAEHSQG